MNYSYKGLEKKEEELNAHGRSIEKRAGLMLLRVFFLALIAALVIGVCGTVGIVRGIISGAPDIDSINISPSGFATFIYDSDGNQIQKLTSADSNRTAVSISRVPISLQHAVVAIEDERFYQHNGIDPKGIVRAFFVGVRNRFHFTEGASTITQQLLKNNVFVNWTQEKTLVDRLKRKFQEQYLAVMLERKLQNKDLILENYLNTINLGSGTYGVQAAAKKYFNKDVWDLTLSESTVLAGITQNPSKYNPIRHPEENAARRERILTKMVEQEYITEGDKAAALADDVYTRIAEAQNVEEQAAKVYSYFVDELTDQVVYDLQAQKGYTENQAYQLLYSGGLRIYTTQDQSLQAICDEEYSNPENFPEGTQYSMDWALSILHPDGNQEHFSKEMLEDYFRENLPSDVAGDFDLLFDSEEEAQSYIDNYKEVVIGEEDSIVAERASFAPQPQSSLVLMDQRTGYVKAIVGGRGKKTASLTLNRATSSYRQPGSTFKILSTYAPAIDKGQILMGSYINDEPFQYANGDDVHNSDNNYRGWITVRDAITYSVNVAAVKTITELTPTAAYQQLLKFGFTSLDAARDTYQPLALGGISKGVSNLELTAAYAAIANDGYYTKPIFYSRILDQNGEVLIDNTPAKTQVISGDTAAILTNAMLDVVDHGTATEVQLDSGMPVAGKTGTTTDYNDVWFVGYTPYYTMGIWAGYDNNEKLAESGIYRSYHKILWKKIMDRISENQIPAEFYMPATVKKMQICDETHLLADWACQWIADDYVGARFAPTRKCEVCSGGRPDPRTLTTEKQTETTTASKKKKKKKVTATPTPAPTASLAPTATPEPTAEPIETPVPTEAPTPEPTAEPTPEPTAEPTPEPTAEPTPEPTAEPTPEPESNVSSENTSVSEDDVSG